MQAVTFSDEKLPRQKEKKNSSSDRSKQRPKRPLERRVHATAGRTLGEVTCKQHACCTDAEGDVERKHRRGNASSARTSEARVRGNFTLSKGMKLR